MLLPTIVGYRKYDGVSAARVAGVDSTRIGDEATPPSKEGVCADNRKRSLKRYTLSE